MPPKSLLWVLALWSLLIGVDGASQRMVHRLVGGHISVLPELDDAELIITSSAGGGRDGKQKSGEEGEEKKTLSQQVADGKYGLIQKELFSKPVKRPGVLSYESNPEVPKDNINNLGGLTKDDIWLAENHLLVIKGGSYPPHETGNEFAHPAWTPIDDYKAPSRQVKIPAHPKVPPPFPVQLLENGPLQIIGTNTTTTLNGTFSAAPYPIQPPEGGGFFPAFPPIGPDPADAPPGETPFPIPAYPQGDFGPPFAPFAMNGSLPPYFASLPPGAAILPPPGNITEYDEDDPSIYYPPPYSFYYQMDNSTQVPPGPLVPGIVLPPPPDFFAPLEKQQKKPATAKPKQRPSQRLTTTTEAIKQIRPTTTPLPPTSVNNKPQRVKPTDQSRPHTTQLPHQRVVTILPARYHPKNRTSSPLTTTLKTYVPNRGPDRRKRPPAVTILKPVKQTTTTTTTTQRPVYFYENNEVNGRPFRVYGPPSTTRQRTVISSTQIPLKAYFSTSNELDTNSVTQPPPEKTYYSPRGSVSSVPQVPTTKSPTQYYFYEEEPVTNSITTQRTPKGRPADPYFNIPNEYYLPAKENNRGVYQQRPQPKPVPQQQPPQQYYYVNNRPSRPSRYRFIETTKKPDTFSLHVARLKQQIHQYYTTPSPYSNYEPQRGQNSPKPVYQFSFQAANYQPQNGFRASPVDDTTSNDDKFRPVNKYSVEIQPAIEVHPNPTKPPAYQSTQGPVYYEKSTTARPEPSKYYSSPQPDYEYEEVEIDDREKNRYVATPSPINQYAFQATQNPIYQPYYTKQDEPFFDDITKKYFTIFGKKIPAVTTPITNIEATTPVPRRPTYSNLKHQQLQDQQLQDQQLQQQQQQQQQQEQQQHQNVQIQYAQSVPKDIPLREDSRVSYAQQEYATGRPEARYPQAPKYLPQPRYLQEPASLHSDVNVNYKHPRPRVNAQAEVVRAVPVKMLAPESKPGSFISYELPGDDGAHFYFLTPQLAQRRDQGAGFYYESPNAPRARRGS